MQINYYNSNFDNVRETQGFDKKVYEILDTLPALNIIFNEKNLIKTIDIVKKFGSNKEKIILFGTGGSNLGARSLHNINDRKKIDIEFYDNVDPVTFQKSFVATNFKKTGFIIISKSGNTPETLAQFATLYEIAAQTSNIDQFLSNILIITEFKDSALYKISKEKNCLTLEHNNKIGGRFSVFSNVGIVPAILSGLNISELYSGASDVLSNSQNFSPLNLAKYLLSKKNNRFTSNVLMTYSDNLYFFGKWYLQLWAESIGKDNKGITAIHSVGTTDQHSQLQLYLDGPKDKFFTFITTKHKDKGLSLHNKTMIENDSKYLVGKKMGDLMEAEQKATLDSFIKNNFCLRQINIPEINEFSIGKLTALSIMETVASCLYFEVNPYDQPAVEQGKILTKKYLS